MNLHIINDEKFFDPFVEKLEELGLLHNNIFIVKENGPLKYIRRKDLVYGRLNDRLLLGNLDNYDKVFIHAFSFDLYRWVNRHTFKELNWMIWGKELYESKMVNYPLYESGTENIIQKIKKIRPMMSNYYRKIERFLFQIDVERVYGKIDYLLTWITPEYEYAKRHIKGLKAEHKKFAYTFEIDAEILSDMFDGNAFFRNWKARKLRCIIGNSGAASNNHLDALKKVKDVDFNEIVMPISYGDQNYIGILKREVERYYQHKNVTFMEQFMSFKRYLDFFNSYDVFVSNSLRPIGMGNIWMALLTGKLIFMNSKNLVFPYLQSIGIQLYDIDLIEQIDIIQQQIDFESNRTIAAEFLSKGSMNTLYSNLFGKVKSEVEYC